MQYGHTSFWFSQDLFFGGGRREEGRGFKITMFSKKFQNFMHNNRA
jgi:hypothetical protein